jgi:tight adherence protein C
VILIVLIALGLLGFAVVMLSRAVALSRGQSGRTLRTIAGYGFVGGDVSDGDGETGLSGLAERLGGAAGRRLGPQTELRSRLVAAGMYDTTSGRFIGYQLLLAIGFAAAWLLISGLFSISSFLIVIGFFWAICMGLLGPIYVLSRKGRMRQAAIDKELPELIDLLVVTVEAGVGFVGSLRVAAERLRGPLSEELRLTLQEQNMGLSATEALSNLSERSPTPGIKIFVRAVMQGETLGVSIGTIMRNVALEMRKRRRALAEERAQKAPVKMLFPLIFLIFPAMFIILLVPAVITFLRALS